MAVDPAIATARPDATYVYCIVKGARRVSAARLRRLPEGLWGAGAPRLLDAGDGYQLLVATVPLSLYSAATIEALLSDLDWVSARATEHESVVEQATQLGTVVPMKLFTLFVSDERALRHVRKLIHSLEHVVERIAGCEEWELRILFDPQREQPEVRRQAIELFERSAEKARSAYRRAELSEDVVLDAVFLVPSASVSRLKSVVADSVESLVAMGCEVALTGPWPAYSFIDPQMPCAADETARSHDAVEARASAEGRRA